jgi:hypothetical protein
MNKLLKEYLEFIEETPIEDISHVGNPTTATNFTRKEIENLQNISYQEKIRNAFKNTPFIFDIVFVFNKDFDASKENSHTNADNYRQKQNQSTGNFKINNKLIKPTENITFVLRGNLSPSQKLPVTPWILAHKIGHAIENKNKNLKQMFFNLKWEIRDSKEFNIFNFKTWDNQLENILANGEYISELIAYYLIKGNLTPNTNNKDILIICNEITKELENIFTNLKGKIINEV